MSLINGIAQKQTPEAFPKGGNVFKGQSLLDNAHVQGVGGLRYEYELAGQARFQRRIQLAAAAEKLRSLKAHHFVPTRRAERIEKSLRALHAPQLFAAPVEEWRWAVDDIESEEQE